MSKDVWAERERRRNMTFYEVCIEEIAKCARIEYPETFVSVTKDIEQKDVKYAVEMLMGSSYSVDFIKPDRFNQFKGYMLKISTFPAKVFE
jgi:hypothetical protein